MAFLLDSGLGSDWAAPEGGISVLEAISRQ